MKSWTYRAKRRQVTALKPPIEIIQEIDNCGWGMFRAKYESGVVEPQEYECVWVDVRVPSYKLDWMLRGNRINILYLGHLIKRLKEHVAYFKA